ncbi:hypothetical protein TNCV_2098141 [Trichonephila clavipes]|nr:hypothetical protein TNCV_2098141 [Trichonephila clavipes]
MSDIGPFPGYFLDDKVPLSRQISWRLQSDDRLNLLSSENSKHAQSLFSPIVMLTTPLQTGSTVLSGQWETHNRNSPYDTDSTSQRREDKRGRTKMEVSDKLEIPKVSSLDFGNDSKMVEMPGDVTIQITSDYNAE